MRVRATLVVLSLLYVGTAPLRSQSPQPSVVFSVPLRALAEVLPTAFTVDADGNSYVVGTSPLAGLFKPTDDAVQKSYTGMIAAKFDAAGNRVWATWLGGTSPRIMLNIARDRINVPSAIAVDPQGNVYVAGSTVTTNFPVVNAVVGMPQGTTNDGFLMKLNPRGSQILYSTYLGAVGSNVFASGLAADPAGNAYVGIVSAATRLAFETRDLSPAGRLGGLVVVKVNPAGGVVYGTRFGSDAGDGLYDLAVDQFGAVHILGGAARPDFPVVNAFIPRCPVVESGVCRSAFVAKMDSTGSRFVYSTFLGATTGASGAVSLGTDPTGSTYVTGWTTASDFPVKNAYQPTSAGDADYFLTKLDPAGSLVFSTYVGGSDSDSARQVLVDAASRPILVGITRSPLMGLTGIQHPDAPLYKSLDAGLTWHGIRNGLWSETNALAVGGSPDRVWYAAAKNGLFTSFDEGESWRPASDGLGADRETCEVKTDPAQPDTAYAGMLYSGTYKTQDRGRHWTQVDPRPFNSCVFRSALAIDGNGAVFLGTEGLRRSGDGGRTWIDVGAGLRINSSGHRENVRSVVFDPNLRGVVYAISESGSLYRSANGGSAWSEVTSLAGSSTTAFAVPRGRPHRLYAQGFRLLRSGDDGETWEPLDVAAGFNSQIVIPPDKPDLIYSGPAFEAALRISTDGGDSWSRRGVGVLPDELTTVVIDPRDGNVVFAAAPIRSVGLALGFDQAARQVRFTSFLAPGSPLRVALDPTGALYAVMSDKGLPTLVKLRTP
jgi:photosystem II stability/assembly factor-like uncharacterized protein